MEKRDLRLATAVKNHIIAVLARCEGNRSRTAEVLGITRNTLISRLVSYGVQETKGKTFKKKVSYG